MQFYVFFIHSGLKAYLLEEIGIMHPELNLSFSNKEFVSMKGPEGYGEKLKNDPVIFARRMGIFIDKTEKPGRYSICVKEGEYWNYALLDSPCDTFELKTAEIPAAAPARAWHKIQEVCDLFDWKISNGESVVEIGSAPGGISYYLLEKGVNLYTIDPADMNENLKKFHHIKMSVFDVRKEHLPKSCDWLVSDLNLNGDSNVSQCKRIVDYYPDLKGGFITIKTPETSDLKNISKWKDSFYNFHTTVFHLPSHKREIGLFFRKKK